ncbi:MAG: bifunctional glutamate N-acetyltransferase/amino-acid acetyltransferase ArgJ [Planctomycetes bacterium]|nr:bifunctional glutamate N-acetyltransferase/amino-acid acetyltransferase ArgJ [Planctomycetota bacterium]
MAKARHITLPAGFVAAAARCGLKTRDQEDMAIIAATDMAVPTAMVTTTNQVVGATVRWDRRILPRGYGRCRAVVVNAGNANTCNGKHGDRDAATMAKLTANCLGCEAEQVLVCSTGVIGQPLDMNKVRAGIVAAAGMLSTYEDAAVARAILTTDTHTKSAVATGRIAGKAVTVAGIAKGSGMIAPSLATMLGFITTDARCSPVALGRALRSASANSFNAISVDGDRSTSDTVVLLASGAAGNTNITGGTPLEKFTKLLQGVCAELAEAIVRDGEGATKLLRIKVRGARSDQEAMAAAKTIAESPLVKCAAHGGDPNWGRILAAAGRSNAKVDQDKASCKIGGLTVMRRGASCPFDRRAAQVHMAGQTVQIELDLHLGRGSYTVLTCDLSRDYVTINAEYHT